MKKFAVLFLIAALVCTSAFATTLQVGGTARFGGDLTDVEDYKEIKNYDFGADARLNLGLFGLATNVVFGSNNGNTVLNTIMTANLRFEVSVVEFALGVGYALPIEIADDGVIIDGKPLDNFFEVFKNSQLLARAAFGVNIGGLGLGVDYKIPFETIVEYAKSDNHKNLDTFKQGKISVSVLCNIF